LMRARPPRAADTGRSNPCEYCPDAYPEMASVRSAS
jgi:hypothetical protein